ncbi:MAG TPA: CHAT domain-containing protein [Saprospiraceae bacterium]|nr:CHAT domain-containing protein [Saprospiraceae bacterium]
MRFSYFLYSFFYLLLSPVAAQEFRLIKLTDSPDSLYYVIKSLNDSMKYSEAAELADETIQFIKLSDSSCHRLLAQTRFQGGFALTELRRYNRAIVLLEQSTSCLQEMNHDGSSLEASALHFLADSYVSIGNFIQADSLFKRAVTLKRKYSSLEEPETINLLKSYARYLSEKGDYEQAINILEELKILIFHKYSENSQEACDLYTLCGNFYFKNSKFEDAVSATTLGLIIQKKLEHPNYKTIYSLCYIAGLSYKHIDEFDKALDYFEEGLLEITKSTAPIKLYLAALHSEIGEIHLHRNDFNKAREHFIAADQLMIEMGTVMERNYAYVAMNMANLYRKKNENDTALLWYYKALICTKNGFEEPHEEIADICRDIGRTYVALGITDSAFYYFDKSWVNWATLHGNAHPHLGQIQAGRALCFQKRFEQLNLMSDLDSAKIYYQKAIELMDQYQKAGTFESEKMKYLSSTKTICNDAMENAWKLYSLNNSKDNLSWAWNVSEKMHGFTLFQASRESDAKSLAGVPDSILLHDQNLNKQTIDVEIKLNHVLNKKLTPEIELEILTLQEELYQSRKRKSTFINFIEQNYPAYYSLKQKLDIISFDELRKLLTPEQTFIEYYVTNDQIYCFVINQQVQLLERISNDSLSLKSLVKSMEQGITQYHLVADKNLISFEQSVKQYAYTAQYLYNKLLKQIAPYLTNELIIVPDEELNQLMFDALLLSKPSDLSNFKTYPFLLNQYIISYAYSANMLAEMMNKNIDKVKSPVISFLAFAPFIQSSESLISSRSSKENLHSLNKSLTTLQYSEDEVKNIEKKFNHSSRIYLSSQASKLAFDSTVSNARIIHLATHAMANLSNSKFSFIAFKDSSNSTDNFKYAADLYNLKLNADLICLSACETNVGKWQNGEGVMSLARGFVYAGTKSIVSSQWKINDLSTMLIMDELYINLLNQKPKNISLTEAKRKYIRENQGRLSHPFYWSAFILLGDYRPITL